jgi:hypothetical protein
LSPYAAPGDAQSKTAVNSPAGTEPDLIRKEACFIIG